jgi:DNA-binding NarL/FixJ family response regulator
LGGGRQAGATILRILIADDNEMVRRGVARLLSSEPNWQICGEAADGSETVRKARELLPDLILLDISMPGINGLEVSRLLRQQVPQARILVISQHDPIQLLPRVLAAGGDACVDKSCLATDLLASIRNIGAAGIDGSKTMPGTPQAATGFPSK